MISYIKGIIDHKSPGRAVIDVNGVGYEIFIPLSTYQKLPAVGDSVKLHTHHHVREDAVSLYGFLTTDEKETFELLLSISGIGAKVALGILSSASVDNFRRAVAQGDMKFLTQIPGIGKKSAERMLLELKDKIGKIHIDEEAVMLIESGAVNDAVSALVNLGISQTVAEYAVYKAERTLGKDAKIEDVIGQALKSMGS